MKKIATLSSGYFKNYDKSHYPETVGFALQTSQCHSVQCTFYTVVLNNR